MKPAELIDAVRAMSFAERSELRAALNAPDPDSPPREHVSGAEAYRRHAASMTAEECEWSQMASLC